MPTRCCRARAWRRPPRRRAARPPRQANRASLGRARTGRHQYSSSLGSAVQAGASLVRHDIELRSGRRIGFENLENIIATVGKRMDHAGRDVDHVVLADDIGLAFKRERALAAFDYIDVIRLAMMMPLAGHFAGK